MNFLYKFIPYELQGKECLLHTQKTNAMMEKRNPVNVTWKGITITETREYFSCPQKNMHRVCTYCSSVYTK